MSFFESLVILLLILILFGPKRMPELVRLAGKVYFHIQRFTDKMWKALDESALEEKLNWNEKRAAKADETYQQKDVS